jgi:hypothetical protein
MIDCSQCTRPAVAWLRFTEDYLAVLDAHDCQDNDCLFHDADVAVMRDDRVPVCPIHRSNALGRARARRPEWGCEIFAWEPIDGAPTGEPEPDIRRVHAVCSTCDREIELSSAGLWIDERTFIGCADDGEFGADLHHPRSGSQWQVQG